MTISCIQFYLYSCYEDMLQEEIRLRNLYNVGAIINYFNLSKQTSMSFKKYYVQIQYDYLSYSSSVANLYNVL